jgi:hypothetical protein
LIAFSPDFAERGILPFLYLRSADVAGFFQMKSKVTFKNEISKVCRSHPTKRSLVKSSSGNLVTVEGKKLERDLVFPNVFLRLSINLE